MLNLSDPYAAWCLDGVVSHFGISLEAALDDVDNKAYQSKRKVNQKQLERKKQRVLEKWLDMPQRFRDPAEAT